MNLINTIVIGLKEIWAHKFRSLLTMFGIVLGVVGFVLIPMRFFWKFSPGTFNPFGKF